MTPQKLISTVEMVNKIFPFQEKEDLKIYAILSAHQSAALFINDLKVRLIVLGAYTLDEALKASRNLLDATIPGAPAEWKNGVITFSMPYQHVVPIDKIAAMVDKIKDEIIPAQSPEDAMKAKIDMMQAYCRYVFDNANATPYEKGILTSVLNRFQTNVTPKPDEKDQKPLA